MKINMVLLDLDDVLVDFTSAACAVHGIDPAILDLRRTPGIWSWTEESWPNLSAAQFWQPINAAGSRFWYSLKPLPWLADLFALADSITETLNEWHIVTSPSWDESCYSGKVAWLKTTFGKSFDRFHLTSYKEMFAKEGTLLIDDREENCEAFTAAGGQAVVFPTLGNKFHAHRADPVAYLKSLLLGEVDALTV